MPRGHRPLETVWVQLPRLRETHMGSPEGGRASIPRKASGIWVRPFAFFPFPFPDALPAGFAPLEILFRVLLGPGALALAVGPSSSLRRFCPPPRGKGSSK